MRKNHVASHHIALHRIKQPTHRTNENKNAPIYAFTCMPSPANSKSKRSVFLPMPMRMYVRAPCIYVGLANKSHRRINTTALFIFFCKQIPSIDALYTPLLTHISDQILLKEKQTCYSSMGLSPCSLAQPSLCSMNHLRHAYAQTYYQSIPQPLAL